MASASSPTAKTVMTESHRGKELIRLRIRWGYVTIGGARGNEAIPPTSRFPQDGIVMRTLVTGGAGFIGSNLVRLLCDAGHEVVVLDDLSSGYRINLAPFSDVQVLEGDIRDEALVKRAVDGVEVVFHLAASVGNKRSIDFPFIDADINVIGSLRILEAARHAGARKVVVSSSAGIFGELKTLPIREDHPVEPDAPYGCTKLCMEKLSLAYAKLYPLEAVSLRYFNVYGPNQRFDAYGNVIPIFVFKMLRGEPLTIFGDGEQTRDFINVRDVAQANYRSGMASGVSGAFNIGSATRVTINHLVELIGEVSGITPKVAYGPTRPGDVRHSLADISAAHAAFAFAPSVDLREGLAEYVAWAREEVARTG
jgi:UDP-glucose 4-epimerase